MYTDPTWKTVIALVLREAGTPLHFRQIAETITRRGMRARLGADPAFTVAGIIGGDLKRPDTLFRKVSRGVYGLRDTAETVISEGPVLAIAGFGVHWLRLSCYALPRDNIPLLGRVGERDQLHDFGARHGVYILYADEVPVFVGRDASGLMGSLRLHTIDRLRERWNRFSWFAMYDRDASVSDVTIDLEGTLSAVLAECLETRFSPRGGDVMANLEHLQASEQEHLGYQPG